MTTGDLASPAEPARHPQTPPRPDLVEAALAGRLRAVTEPPDSFSFSAFATFAHCPLAYALKYVCGIEPAEPIAAFAFGRAAHRAFELFTRARRVRAEAAAPAPDRSDLDAFFEAAWAEAEFPNDAVKGAWHARVPAMLDHFFATESVRNAATIGEEASFGLALELVDGARVALTGIIDRLDRTPDGRLDLIDYKTGPAWAPGATYDLQLAIYALACRDALDLGAPDRALVYFVEHSLFAARPVPAASLDAVRADAAGRAAEIRASDFAPTPSPAACRWCDFREICPVPAGVGRGNGVGAPAPAAEDRAAAAVLNLRDAPPRDPARSASRDPRGVAGPTGS